MTEEIAKLEVNVNQMSGEIVAAYVSNNHVALADLPALIATVQAAISGLATGSNVAGAAEPEIEKPPPAQIKKSIRRESLISFIDGKSYKTLKRHLTKHGLEPYSYRSQYGLPSDYPMVAPAYSEKRSNLARSAGLGRLGDREAPARDASPTKKGRRAA